VKASPRTQGEPNAGTVLLEAQNPLLPQVDEVGEALAHGEEGLEGVSNGPLEDHKEDLGSGGGPHRARRLQGHSAGGVVGPQLGDAGVEATEG
jgi:hypothetical protein